MQRSLALRSKNKQVDTFFAFWDLFMVKVFSFHYHEPYGCFLPTRRSILNTNISYVLTTKNTINYEQAKLPSVTIVFVGMLWTWRYQPVLPQNKVKQKHIS